NSDGYLSATDYQPVSPTSAAIAISSNFTPPPVTQFTLTGGGFSPISPGVDLPAVDEGAGAISSAGDGAIGFVAFPPQATGVVTVTAPRGFSYVSNDGANGDCISSTRIIGNLTWAYEVRVKFSVRNLDGTPVSGLTPRYTSIGSGSDFLVIRSQPVDSLTEVASGDYDLTFSAVRQGSDPAFQFTLQIRDPNATGSVQLNP
ncbi:MAG: hypothetical protein KGR26_08695, partial [Cyanobacteria bacterium REEB65]|nr:hypothetical protein [Cyanobacteria bacterium REEB65]